MANPFERTVSFEAIDKKDRRPVPYQVLRFAVEPPIQVHDPSFLDKAIQREVQPTGWKYFFGDFPYVDGVNVIYTDEQATHGTAKVHAAANQGELHKLITTAFTKELNPLGNVALSFNFDADFPKPA